MILALIELVESKPAITGLIGTNPVRLHALHLPQGKSETPAVAYRWFNNVDHPTMDAPSQHDYASVDLQCYGRSLKEASEVWMVLREELEGATGEYGGLTITGVSYRPSGAEDYLENLKRYTKQLELMISYLR